MTRASASNAVGEFFDELGRRGYEPLLRKASGTVRFDVVADDRTDRRYLTIDRGHLTLSRRKSTAESVIRANRALFARLARGEANPFSAVLRGELGIEGDPRLLVLLRRLFRGPPGTEAEQR